VEDINNFDQYTFPLENGGVLHSMMDIFGILIVVEGVCDFEGTKAISSF